MSYVYKRIRDLEASPQPQHFYGKLIFHGVHDKQHVLLLKDETGLIYVWVKPKENQVLRFQLRQVIRFHRCVIGWQHSSVKGTATIGKAGCHLVAWPASGNPLHPVIISSKEWTRSPEDRERIETLSKVERRPQEKKVTVEEMANKLIEVREGQRAKVIVSSWIKRVRQDEDEKLHLTTKELYAQWPGTLVESKSNFPIDRSFFDEEYAEEFVQFFRKCKHCFDDVKKVKYIREDNPIKCPNCKKTMKELEVAVRVRIDVDGFNFIFTIPIRLVEGHENLPNLSDYLTEMAKGKKDDERKMIRFCRMAQRTLWDATLTGIRGRIMGRSENLNFVEIFLFELQFLDLSN
ncbi:unnamed protein product [Caenorhabditis sp. 36 PRJEB53466]|nr:unnamed protein product [Caenorhabditis sp. 36 PRJEB53466]